MKEALKQLFQKVLVIDDKKEEVENLIKYLERENIKTIFLEPNDKESDEYFENFKGYPGHLIFLDLYLDSYSGTSLSSHISKIRRILTHIIGKKDIAYGIILWSSHSNEIQELQNRILEDNEYVLPLFVFGMDKGKYEREPEKIFEDIATKLEENTAASFYIKWSHIIENAKSKVLNDVFGLIKDYEHQDKNLEFLLFHMAKNHIGISDDDLSEYSGLGQNAFSSFTELLSDDIKHYFPINCNLFTDKNLIEFLIKKDGDLLSKKSNEYLLNGKPIHRKDEKRKVINEEILKLYAALNSKLLLDFTDFGLVLPGNVYINNNPCIYSNKMSNGDIPIIIELSPPCDFANKNKYAMPKFVSGFITHYENIKDLKSNAIYTETYPLLISNLGEEIYGIALDFRYVNNISEKEIKAKGNTFLFRVKDKLFADILQKMSSYTARLGLSIIKE